MTYDYNQPSRVNLVSIFFLLMLVGGVYAAVKFVPVYWQGKKVDRVLDELAVRAVDLGRLNDSARRQEQDEIVNRAIADIHDLGVEDTADAPLEVWFTPDFSQLHARYDAVVAHPGNLVKPTVFHMERVVEVPR